MDKLVYKAFAIVYCVHMSAYTLRVPDELPLVYAFVAKRMNAERLKRGLKPNIKPTELMRDALAWAVGMPVTHEDFDAVATFAKEYKGAKTTSKAATKRTTKRT